MSLSFSARLVLVAALVCPLINALPSSAQQPKKSPTPPPDDVIRVDTELIQSPIIVLDKQGRFVADLSREQFELSINGRPKEISFFEQIAAGTRGEAEKYEVARKGASPAEKGATSTSAYGRTVVFFIDDLHLNAESVNRTRTAVSNFIDHSLGQNDRALVIAASGAIGFLQQMTDNKDVLHAAIDRLKHHDFFLPDDAKPPMTAYQALAIENGDSGALQYFADFTVTEERVRTDQDQVRGQPQTAQAVAETDRRGESRRNQAESGVKNRARNVLSRYSSVSNATLTNLKQALASLAQLAGSKLVFFISDGFFLNQQATGELEKLNEITSGALRAGTVVYSVQASGLSTAMTTASADVRLSPRMDTGATMIGQDGALQAPLYTVAVDTGGRALFNSNSMDSSLQQAMQETSRYYLLAWRPEQEEKRSDAFQKIQVTIKGHPDWSVRMQKGYYLANDSPKGAAAKTETKPQPVAEVDPARVKADKMRETISSLYPVRDLPTLVNVSFLDDPAAGPVLNVGTEFSVAPLLPQAEGAKSAAIALFGVVLNDEGKTVTTFGGQLKFELGSSTSPGQSVPHVDQVKVKPGLYQVRVAARDEASGLAGSAAEWILVPDLSKGKVTLSSLLIGDVNGVAAGTGPDQKAQLSINHHFTRDGRLRFLTYIYNATRGPDGKSDVTVQLRVTRDDQVLSTSPQIRVPTDGVEDPARVPYGAQLALKILPPGRYLLAVTANDHSAKTSATQNIKFVIE